MPYFVACPTGPCGFSLFHSCRRGAGYSAPSGLKISGFNLRKEGILTCQTMVPTANFLDCPMSLSADTIIFSHTAAFADRSENPHSAPIALAKPNTSGTVRNTIFLHTKWTSYTAPSSYTTSGYNLYLEDGLLCQTQNSSATSPDCTASLPGDSGCFSLTDRFTNDNDIISYAWDLSDGSTSTEANTTHFFTAAGTYTTALNVTSSNGYSNSASTPKVVSAAVVANAVSTAFATPISGAAPLIASVDGSKSADSNGTIIFYFRDCSDNSIPPEETATHVYTTKATIIATIKIIDNQYASSTTIALHDFRKTLCINIEVSEVEITSNWIRVQFESTFARPIMVADLPLFGNNDPCTIRIRDVSATGFDIKTTEWYHPNGIHPAKKASCLVMEKGRTLLPGGALLEAVTFSGTNKSETANYCQPFAKIPVVQTTYASMNEAGTISSRVRKAGLTGFSFAFREQAKKYNSQTEETVNYIAWEPWRRLRGNLAIRSGHNRQYNDPRIVDQCFSAHIQ